MFKDIWLEGIELPRIAYDPAILPAPEDIFRCLEYFEPKDTKCIIVGQDPYPNREDADGLAFSVPHSRIPGSLRNIFNELFEDTGCYNPPTGSLDIWAKEGVLLLNRILTVREGRSNSHSSAGWGQVTAQIVQKAIDSAPALALIMWGKEAQKLTTEVRIGRHVLPLTGGHPSPLNRDSKFAGGRYFSRANLWLAQNGVEPIDWRL
jgi:uracil-DNA glycosylase